ncbi:preprotein translocase subunit SecY [Maricaulis sp.]|uniref:preprotein translocase subunit SecY n=1 Tax=Maricaulis sp. TaxID=1486257 RepID=UPI00342A7500
MASAAEQLAANMNFSSFAKAKELQQRILFTIGILIVYRIGTYVPIPGIDPVTYAAMFQQNAGGLMSWFNTLGGGAIERMAIFALNVMPYISASIIMQLMAASIPTLEKLKKEGGEAGRKQINQYTRYLTVVLATLQATAIAIGMNSPNPDGSTLALEPGLFFVVSTVTTLVGGTMLLLWLGEQITARGIGNGVSLIIFAGIIAAVPSLIGGGLSASASTGNFLPLLMGVSIVIGFLVLVVFVERSQRRLIVQYPKRQQGNRMVGGDTSFLPLKLNTAGVIPPIFASSLLLLPATALGFQAQSGPDWLQNIVVYLQPGAPVFLVIYGAMIIFFCFFYTSIVFNPEDTADNLRKYGGFLPGIRPGKRTAEHIDFIQSRLTAIGAVYLTFICVVPMMLGGGAAMALGGTSILIVVSVTMDTISQIQSHLLAHQYEGLIKKSKLRGRKR